MDASSGGGTPGSPVVRNPYVVEEHVQHLVLDAVKLSNNGLKTCSGVPQALAPVLRHDLAALRWLDLSFNAVTSVDLSEFAVLPSLAILNLHCNRLAVVTNLRAGAAMQLRSLTLYENPVTSKSSQRLVVVAAFPTLRKLDGQVVTPIERRHAKHDAGLRKVKNVLS